MYQVTISRNRRVHAIMLAVVADSPAHAIAIARQAFPSGDTYAVA